MPNRLPPQSIRLSRHHERWVYAAATLLIASGLLWLLFHYFVSVQSDFGAIRHPLEAWWLKAHGAAAMLTLVLIGTMMPVHVRKAWHAGKNRWTGSVLLAVLAALILTAYALYYFAGEESRPWISVIHWAVGLAMVPAMIAHVVNGRAKHVRRTGRASRQPTRHRPSGSAPQEMPAAWPVFPARLVAVVPGKPQESPKPADGRSTTAEG